MNKNLIPAFLLTLVNVLGFSILMPVLPFIVKQFNGEEWVYGLLLTLYSSFQFFGAPYLGAMSDRIGRKPVLLISQAGTLFAWIVFLIALYIPEYSVFGFSLTLIIIALSRVLDGITGGNTSVANAYVSDITTQEQKSYIFGYLGGIAGIGMIIGPGIGGITASSPLGYSGTILVAMLISIVTLFALFYWLKESHPLEKRNPSKSQSLASSIFIIKRIRLARPKPIVKIVFLIKLLFSIMMAFYISSIALYMIDLFQFNETELGIFMLVVGIFLSFNQAFISKLVIAKVGAFKTLLIGLSLCIVGFFAITISDQLVFYILCYYILNLGLSLCFPTFNAIISMHADPVKQGEYMGISESLNSLAMAAIPILGASIYGLIGFQMYYFVALLPFTALIFAFIWQSKDQAVS